MGPIKILKIHPICELWVLIHWEGLGNMTHLALGCLHSWILLSQRCGFISYIHHGVSRVCFHISEGIVGLVL